MKGLVFFFIDKIARSVGREGYFFDRAIPLSVVFIICFRRSIALFRFWCIRFRFQKSALIGFVGERCSMLALGSACVGRGFYVGNNCTLNFLCRSGVSVGNNVTIKDGSIIECSGVFSEIGDALVIGSNVGISQNCFIQVRGRVEIGDDVILGPGVKIFSENHIFNSTDTPIRNQGVSRMGVTIGQGAWLGAGCTILDGVSVGRNSVVAAGSVVSKSVADGAVVGGIPARLIKRS